MNNISGYIKTLAYNPYKRIEPYGIISAEKQVSWALDYAEQKIEEAKNSSCKGLAHFPIMSVAQSLVEADSVENTPEHAERIRKLNGLLLDVELEWESK